MLIVIIVNNVPSLRHNANCDNCEQRPVPTTTSRPYEELLAYLDEEFGYSAPEPPLVGSLPGAESFAGAVLCWDETIVEQQESMSFLEVVRDHIVRLCKGELKHLGIKPVNCSAIISSKGIRHFSIEDALSTKRIACRRISQKPRRTRYEVHSGQVQSTVALENLMTSFETSVTGKLPGILYIAELTIKCSKRGAKSLIAQLWEECLGNNAIPFDCEARRRLIDQGRRHCELKLHLDAWEEMARSGIQHKHYRGDSERKCLDELSLHGRDLDISVDDDIPF